MIKKMMDLLKEWFGKKNVSMVTHEAKETSMKKETTPRKLSLLDDLETYLFDSYDFRFNVLTEQTEFRKKGENTFRLVDQRMLNSFCMEARKQNINCWDKDVSRLLLSQEITDFHPFLHYVVNLPEWDGIDRVSELAQRVSGEDWWVNGFHRCLFCFMCYH